MSIFVAYFMRRFAWLVELDGMDEWMNVNGGWERRKISQMVSWPAIDIDRAIRSSNLLILRLVGALRRLPKAHRRTLLCGPTDPLLLVVFDQPVGCLFELLPDSLEQWFDSVERL